MEGHENNFNFSDEQLNEEQSYTPADSFEPAPKKPGKKSSRSVLRAVLSVVLVLALVGGSCGLTYAVLNEQWSTKAQASANNASQLQPLSTSQSGMQTTIFTLF